MGHSWAGALQDDHKRCTPRCCSAAVVMCASCMWRLRSCALGPIKSHRPHWLFSAAYYRGAMGILLVYSVNDEASFNNVRNWMKNIETHASSSVNKVRHWLPVAPAIVLGVNVVRCVWVCIVRVDREQPCWHVAQSRS